MTDGNEKALKGDQTLAHLLEFLARLDESQPLRERVIEEIKKEVEKYLKDDDKFSSTSSGYLFDTIKKCQKLRKKIVKTEQKYEHFTQSFDSDDVSDEQYTELLINNVFPLFGCLYYMYFECSDDCIIIDGGGEWYDEKCDGKGRYQYLNHWLTDQTPSTDTAEDATDTPEDGTKRMIQRGFKQDELSNKKGEYLFPNEEHEKDRSNRLLNYEYGAQLQFALYYMLFLPEKWNRGQSGHALLFLHAFCEKVSGGQFNGHYKAADDGKSFKTACQSVTEKISTLTTLKIIVPVAWSPKVNYKDLLEATHFWDYVKWLKDNLEQLITSLTEMKNDASNWDYTELITSETFGPYPWGFTFKDQNWESKTGQIKQQLSQLTAELESFKKKLQSLSATRSKGQSEKAAEKSSTSSVSTTSTTSTTSTNSANEPSNSTTSPTSNNSTDSTDSTASTLGGVAGGIGAAAATGAAAYAGSGFLGPVAEAVGKFFKGLFF